MSRLTRADTQLRTRARIVAAARAEFAARGYRDTTIDRIAARADLTRGAVYSNFPGKRALYFTALTSPAEPRPSLRGRAGGRRASTASDLAACALAWLDREHPSPDAVAELADLGTQYAGLMELNAVLLGLSLGEHRLGVSRLALTLLAGATQLSPGFVQPLAVAEACAHLADLDLADAWTPPPTRPPVRPVEEAWTRPPVDDEVLRRTANLDGVIVVLGLNRLAAVEDVVRTTSAPTIALVSSQPGELGPLARYTTDTVLGCLQQPPRIQLVHDEDGVLASALGCEVIGDDVEYAALVDGERIISRAEGFGAAYAIAAQAALGQAAMSSIPSVSTPSARAAAPTQRTHRN
ncbi:TetR/AcrR family transcriptional regulator [Kribbella sp. NPDC055071]